MTVLRSSIKDIFLAYSAVSNMQLDYAISQTSIVGFCLLTFVTRTKPNILQNKGRGSFLFLRVLSDVLTTRSCHLCQLSCLFHLYRLTSALLCIRKRKRPHFWQYVKSYLQDFSTLNILTLPKSYICLSTVFGSVHRLILDFGERRASGVPPVSGLIAKQEVDQ